MIFMYLTEDVKSHTRKVILAKKGDKVIIVERTLNMVLCSLTDGQKFWTRNEKLSIKPL
jgi:hypothetical protein